MTVTQPAVSMAVAALEKGLGEPLFQRRGRRSELTPLGQQLLPQARRLLALAARDAGDPGRGGAPWWGGCGWARRQGRGGAAGRAAGGVPRRLSARGVSRSPRARWGRCLRRSATGDLDGVVLGERLRGHALDYAPVADDEWLLIAPPGYPWTPGALMAAGGCHSYPVLTLDALREQPLVVAGAEGGSGRREGLAALEERGLVGRAAQIALDVPGEGAGVCGPGGGGLVSRSTWGGRAGRVDRLSPARRSAAAPTAAGPPAARHPHASRRCAVGLAGGTGTGDSGR